MSDFACGFDTMKGLIFVIFIVVVNGIKVAASETKGDVFVMWHDLMQRIFFFKWEYCCQITHPITCKKNLPHFCHLLFYQ